VSNGNASQTLGYARAIYELALEGWQATLTAVDNRLNEAGPDLLAKLDNTQLPFNDRRQELDALLPADVSGQARNFFYTLLKEGHLTMLGEIAANLTQLSATGYGVQAALVTTAIPLTDAEKQQFQTKLSAKYGDNLALDFVVDEKIIGGVVVQIGDKILDGSVAAKLDAARESLMTA